MKAQTNRESGFALLLLFAMAGAVAVLLYKEMPRLMFESQRIKEQELVYRGEQYARAIQLFVRKNKKYPQTIDELEKGSGIRFLRRKYKDPMTGKDEWRLVHIDNAGFYTDSLVHKPAAKEEEKKSQNTFITEGASFGSTGPAPGQEQAQGPAFRGASDRPAAGPGQFEGPPGGVPGQEPADQQEQLQQQEQAEQQEEITEDTIQENEVQFEESQQEQQQEQEQEQEQEQVQDPGQQPYPDPNQQQLPGQPQYPGQPQLPMGAAPYVPGQIRTVQPGQQVPYGYPQPGQPGFSPYQRFPGQPGAYPQPVQPGGYPQPGQQPGPYPQPGQPGAYPQPGYPPQQYPPQANPYQQLGLAPYVAPGMQRPGTPPGQPYLPPGMGGVPVQPGSQYPPNQPQGMGNPPGVGAAGATNPAQKKIMEALTSPRPGGLPGQAAAGGTGGIPGGIAGVASKLETKGIMVYNERSKYNEWEFLYDMKKEQEKAAGAAGAVAQEPGEPGQTGPLSSGQQRSPQTSSFGGGFGSTGGTGFGAQPQAPPPPPRTR
jgi:hypothetical protein